MVPGVSSGRTLADSGNWTPRSPFCSARSALGHTWSHLQRYRYRSVPAEVDILVGDEADGVLRETVEWPEVAGSMEEEVVVEAAEVLQREPVAEEVLSRPRRSPFQLLPVQELVEPLHWS